LGQGAEPRVGLEPELLGCRFDLHSTKQFCGPQLLQDDLHLSGRVVDPPDLSCSEEELLFFQLEHEEFQQLAFAPQNGGHVVKHMVVLLSKRHMA
jgi:hypothetical protein